jgi:hypothetical protein
VTGDHRLIEDLPAGEAGQLREPAEAARAEPPVDELIVRVDLASGGDEDGGILTPPGLDAVGLQQHAAALGEPPTEHAQQPQRVFDAVQDAAAVDEVEATFEPVQLKGVQQLVVDT